MKISPVCTISYQSKNKLSQNSIQDETKLSPDAFFYTMNGYGKNYVWAQKMSDLVFDISQMIKNNADFDVIRATIEEEIRRINNDSVFCERDFRGYRFFQMQNSGRGDIYTKRFQEKFCDKKTDFSSINKMESNDEYKNANTVTIVQSPYMGCFVEYGCSERSNLELIKEEYRKLKSLKTPTLKDINKSCATIQWLIAQETPYKKGSDSFANTLCRSIYLSYGYKTSAPKKNTGLDFEAWGCNLDEYIKIYPDLFKTPPIRH